MPVEIKRFENCILLGLALAFAYTMMGYQPLSQQYGHGFLWSVILTSILFTVTMVALVSRAHRRWPAWVLLFFFIAGHIRLISGGYLVGVWFLDLMTIAMTVLQGYGLWMVLFTRAGREWTSKAVRNQPVANTARLGL